MTHPASSDSSAHAAPDHDPDALARLKRFGGTKLLLEMIALYLTAAPERISAAAEGVRSGKVADAELALHSLKSSSAQLGAMRISRLSERGETIARTGTMDGLQDIIAELEDGLMHVQAWLQRVWAEEAA